MLAIFWAGARRLKSDDLCMHQQYLENLEQFFAEHLLLQKVQHIENDLLTQTLQPHHKAKLEQLNNLWIQGMLQAECQCHKLNT